jgi:hypothetical protein
MLSYKRQDESFDQYFERVYNDPKYNADVEKLCCQHCGENMDLDFEYLSSIHDNYDEGCEFDCPECEKPNRVTVSYEYQIEKELLEEERICDNCFSFEKDKENYCRLHKKTVADDDTCNCFSKKLDWR